MSASRRCRERCTRAGALVAVAALVAASATAAVAHLPLLVDGSLSQWQERSFAGSTRYRVEDVAGVPALRADARAAASGLYLERVVALEQWPVLRWRWRVERALDPPDERTRAGDDFAARVYVIASHPLFFWKTRAVCYVWAADATPEDAWPNPFTDSVVVVALRSGDAQAGRWVEERRDVAADFRRAFGDAPPQVDAVAIMTDTDQTGAAATAWYEGLRFEKRPPGAPGR